MKLLLAVAEAKEESTNIKQLVRYIGNKCLNLVEISAQEAAYVARSSVCSFQCERVELLKF